MKALLASLAFCVVAFLVAVSFGSSEYTLIDALRILAKSLMGAPLDAQESLGRTILLEIRAPRTLVAALCGGALAAAGVLSQGLFRNSLASPSVLGTTAGGSLAAALAFYLGPVYLHWLMLPGAAFLGALLATLFLFQLAERRGGMGLETLLLAGFAVNALLGAGTSLVVSFMLEDHQKAAAVMHWLLGGFSAKGWEHLGLGTPPIVVGIVAATWLGTRLDVLALGEDVAQSLSVDLVSLRRLAIFGIALLVGTSVSLAGAVPFVGLLVPHLTRLLTGPRHKPLLVASILNGMALVMLADLAARTLRAPAEIEVGILTSLLGAPFFLWLLLAKRSGESWAS